VVTTNADLVVQCFDGATGKPLWKRDLIAENEGRNIQWKNAASPLFEGGLIYVAGGGAGQSLLALDPKTGAIVAKAFDEKMTHATPVVGSILGQRQIIFFLQSGLLAVEPKTLKELWRYSFDYRTSTAASPVIAGDVVYCSAGYGVGAGAVKVSHQGTTWKATELFRSRGDKPLANHWSTPILHNGHLYGMFQFKQYGDGPVKCVDLKDGSVKWEQPGFGPGQVVKVRRERPRAERRGRIGTLRSEAWRLHGNRTG
jgi:outer membrane protein assembly factor BamB